MDDRIRAAERSGNRQRLLVELHRAGRPIEYQDGDRVVPITKNEQLNSKVGTISGGDPKRYFPYYRVIFDEAVTYFSEYQDQEVTTLFIYLMHYEMAPEGC